MYVAITRARKRLYLSFSQTRMLHGQTRYNVKSRFFDELPEGALKWLTPRNQGFGSGYAREYQSAWARGSGLGSMVGAGRVRVRRTGAGLRCRSTPAGARPALGQSVFHTKFGEGVIVTLEGRATTRARRSTSAATAEVAGAGDRQADAGRLSCPSSAGIRPPCAAPLTSPGSRRGAERLPDFAARRGPPA